MTVIITDRAEMVDWVRSFVGRSLDHDPEGELARLVCFPGDDPAQDVQIHTNCAMFALGLWRQWGARHPLLLGHYVNQMALTWGLHIARDAGGLYAASDGPGPQPGDVLHYATSGKNDDHFEFLISPLDARGFCIHAGAGRARNAVTESAAISDHRWDYGRPLRHWIDSVAVVNYPPV
jgi:hypothetical protein